MNSIEIDLHHIYNIKFCKHYFDVVVVDVLKNICQYIFISNQQGTPFNPIYLYFKPTRDSV